MRSISNDAGDREIDHGAKESQYSIFSQNDEMVEHNRIVHERALPTDTDTDGETHEDTDRKRWKR